MFGYDGELGSIHDLGAQRKSWQTVDAKSAEILLPGCLSSIWWTRAVKKEGTPLGSDGKLDVLEKKVNLKKVFKT